jgi:hypothetical protein
MITTLDGLDRMGRSEANEFRKFGLTPNLYKRYDFGGRRQL